MNGLEEKHVLVTGGSGYLGKTLVEKLLSEGGARRVTTLDRSFLDYRLVKAFGRDRIGHVRLNLSTTERPLKLPKDIDVIAHLAAYVPKKSEEDSIEDSFSTNILGTIHLLDCLESFEAIVYASTLEVYGNPIYVPIDENHPTSPKTFYGVSKLSAEKYLAVYCETNLIPLTILRFSSIYGPGERFERAIPNFIRSVSSGMPPVIFGSGADVRDYVYLDDAADAIVQALKLRRHGTYNIGSGRGVAVREVAEKIVKLYKKNLKPIYRASNKPSTNIILDIKRARQDLSYTPRTDLEVGLLEEIEWYESLQKTRPY